jgi:cell division protein FtsN
MTQDFATKSRSKASARNSLPPAASERTFSFATFVTGFLSGAFITFLATLGYLEPTVDIPETDEGGPKAETQASVEEMEWDFYEIFPKLVVPMVQEYTESSKKTTDNDLSWILQAGSFKDSIDADQRRATLILMGLDVHIQEVKVAGDTWHRVMVGPFDSQLERNRAQNKLAQAEISTISIKIQDSLN